MLFQAARNAARVGVPTGRRLMSTTTDAAGEARYGAGIVKREIAYGSALGLVFGTVWMIWAKGQYKKLDNFNALLREDREKRGQN
mmetsp:Transcript_3216/g.4636  ORF Transcript_3216/g.4636 Transcript_3216/m.4636 type:complete len:85 (+) Transcript_3216:312-566(+)